MKMLIFLKIFQKEGFARERWTKVLRTFVFEGVFFTFEKSTNLEYELKQHFNSNVPPLCYFVICC
jgi:hypothetical protein